MIFFFFFWHLLLHSLYYIHKAGKERGTCCKPDSIEVGQSNSSPHLQSHHFSGFLFNVQQPGKIYNAATDGYTRHDTC